MARALHLFTLSCILLLGLSTLHNESRADDSSKSDNGTVLFVLTNHSQLGDTGQRTGFFLSELTHPYYIIKDAGYDIELASILGGPAPIDPKSLDMKDPVNQRFAKDVDLLAGIQMTKKLSELDHTNYNAIVFSGGHGTMWDFSRNGSIQTAIANIYDAGGVVAAVCHGPAALVDVRLGNGEYLVDGKQIAVFTDEEERIIQLENVVPYLLESTLIEQGAINASKGPWQEAAVADQRLVTGQNPQSASKLGKLIVSELQKISIK